MRGIAALLLPALLAACGPGPAALLQAHGETMGTTWSVSVVAPPPALRGPELEALAGAALAEVDERMSTWRDDSELMRFNRSRSTGWFPVSLSTARVVQEALRIGELSAGAFDPTVAPLVELWGFAGRPATRLPPAADALARARARGGHRELSARTSPPALRKRRADLAVDLSGIAKGHAVDRIAERLAGAGARHFLVEIGGELRAAGRNRRGEPWRVAVEQPSLARGRVQGLLALRNEAIATSGSYRNFAARGKRRFAHIIDPTTGAPPENALVSVSVVAPSAMRADGLATALFALGPERGLALAEREGLAALFLLADGGTLSERSTASYDARRLPAAPLHRED